MSARVLLLFCDGVGIGENNTERNPFAAVASPLLPFYRSRDMINLPQEGLFIPTHVDMGIAGLPQSATGQTALLCGINSAKLLNRHVSGFPTPTLRKVLDQHSLFLQIRRLGKIGTFANALSEEYFKQRGERISATTRALLAGGFPPRMIEDIRRKQAVSHDLTNDFLRKLGYEVPVVSVEESGRILLTLIDEADFCLFEFILSDLAGHKRDMALAKQVIETLHRLLITLLEQYDPRTTTIIFTSDHGNMEDLSVKTHTHNPVPTMVWGYGRRFIPDGDLKIEQIASIILKILASRPMMEI